MATAPTPAAPAKKRRPQGPRTVKPKTLYVAVKGSVEEIRVFEDADQVMDLQDSEPGVYKVKRHVMATKPRAKPEGANSVGAIVPSA